VEQKDLKSRLIEAEAKIQVLENEQIRCEWGWSLIPPNSKPVLKTFKKPFASKPNFLAAFTRHGARQNIHLYWDVSDRQVSIWVTNTHGIFDVNWVACGH